MKYSVSVERCHDYEPETVRRAISDCLGPLGGMGAYVNPGDRVLIKINLLTSKPPDKAVTTHPSFVRTAVEMVREAGGVPVVGDSPGGRNTPESYKALLRRTGIMDIIDETGAEFVYFDDPQSIVPAENGRVYKKFTVTGALENADKVICLPKLKTHQLTHFTGAVKLLYGYIPGLMKSEYHLFTAKDVDTFVDLLLDLNETFPPTLSIMDAVIGMEGAGPHNGTPRDIGLCLASTSSTALDFVAATILGYDTISLPTIRKAAERTMGPAEMDEITLFGVPPHDVMLDDFKRAEIFDTSNIPPSLRQIAQLMLASRPVIDASQCVRCGTCAEDCPPGAIEFSKGMVPDIDHGQCIRCFCCQELCPEGAVKVKTPLLRRLIGYKFNI